MNQSSTEEWDGGGAVVEESTSVSRAGGGQRGGGPFTQSTSRRSATAAAAARRAVSRVGAGARGTGNDLTVTGGGRQSLLGRPVNRSRPNRRRDARYRRFQVDVYNFLERPKNWRSILYHLFV